VKSIPLARGLRPAGQHGKSFRSAPLESLLPRRAKRKVLGRAADFKKAFGVKTPLWGFAGHPFARWQTADLPGRGVRGEGTTAVALDN